MAAKVAFQLKRWEKKQSTKAIQCVCLFLATFGISK